MLPAYAELHCRSNFSFLHGASHPEELVARAHELGYAALAITDECTLAGVVRAHGAARQCGLHLIVGAEIALSPVNKIIQGDWNWHANRNVLDGRSAWHNYRGKARYNMLFGDSHVEFFEFPKETPNWIFDPKPDPGFRWW